LDIQAVKNQKLKQHSYVTSHNIRNSVANMLGLFEMIEKNPDDTGIYLKMLKSSVGVLDKTINNLNKLLNEEKEANYKDLKKINVKSTLKSIIDLEYIEINNQKADINLICESDIYIKTLPVFFKSVFHNLISNALKYGLTKNSKIVDITVQKSDDGLSIEVKDYGKGFNAEENEELIFKYGTRLNMDTIGQGLGLFITNHHVRLIGADIIVDSSEGKGASFKVVFEDKYICNG
jgi:signal transduction histidine kinase